MDAHSPKNGINRYWSIPILVYKGKSQSNMDFCWGYPNFNPERHGWWLGVPLFGWIPWWPINDKWEVFSWSMAHPADVCKTHALLAIICTLSIPFSPRSRQLVSFCSLGNSSKVAAGHPKSPNPMIISFSGQKYPMDDLRSFTIGYSHF